MTPEEEIGFIFVVLIDESKITNLPEVRVEYDEKQQRKKPHELN